MSAGTSPTLKNERRVEVTLRGLRFTSHPEVPKELRGTVVPWLRAHLFTQHGATIAHCYREDGHAMRVGKRYLAPTLAMSDGPIAKRAQFRARRNALADGTIELTVIDSEWRARRIISSIAPILVASVLVVMVWGWVGPQGRTWSGFLAWIAPNWAMATLSLFALGSPLVMVCILLRSAGKANVRSIRLTAEDFSAEVHRLGTVQARWDQVRKIRRAALGHEVRLDDGRTLRIAPGRASFFLNDRIERLHGPLPTRTSRRLLIVVLGAFQVGGLVAAYLNMTGAAQFPFGPVRTYFVVAFAYPAAAAFAALVPWSFVRVAQWANRRSRKHARQIRQGRIAG